MSETQRLYAGADWIVDAGMAPNGMSDLGRDAADLLGDLFLGIYHMDSKHLAKVDWSNDHHIAVTVYGAMSTYDNDMLTRLVLLSHDRMLRVEISARTHKYVGLLFHRRHGRHGPIARRMPTLEAHVAQLRRHYAGPDARPSDTGNKLALALSVVRDLLEAEAGQRDGDDANHWKLLAKLVDSTGVALSLLWAWCQAYPVEAFPEPDMARAHELLQAGGVALGAVSASNMRHVLSGVARIIEEVVSEKEDDHAESD